MPGLSTSEFHTQRLSFKVNGPPHAVPLPAGHPYGDFLANEPTYRIEEGQLLRLEADESTPPEALDTLVAYQWDLDEDGIFEREGQRILFDQEDQGVYVGHLRVEDEFGLTDQTEFLIEVSDVHPQINGGGPYSGVQGQELAFDASLTQAQNESDPLSHIQWDWGDGK